MLFLQRSQGSVETDAKVRLKVHKTLYHLPLGLPLYPASSFITFPYNPGPTKGPGVQQPYYSLGCLSALVHAIVPFPLFTWLIPTDIVRLSPNIGSTLEFLGES